MAGESEHDKRDFASQPTVLYTVTTEDNSADGFGGKNITFLGGCCLLINNITGPGIPALGLAFQDGGWLFSTFLLVVFTILSTLCSGFLAEAMTKVRGNSRFQGRVEFTYLTQKLFSRRAYVFILIIFMFSFQVSNIASVIESSQTADITLIQLFDGSCGLEIYDPSPAPNTTFYPGFRCIHDQVSQGSPYGSCYVISVGFMLVLSLSIPLGFMNLDDNIIVQIVSTFLLLGTCLLWGFQFLAIGMGWAGNAGTGSAPGWKSVPAIGNNLSSVIGTILFNFGWGTTVPSWINEKRPEVGVNRSMWWSSFISLITFLIVGLVACLAITFGKGEDNLLETLASPGMWNISKITADFFPWAVLLPGIPVFSVMVRYNLLENKLCNKFWANMFAVLFPWACALFFYAGNFLEAVLNWSALFIMVPLNFTIPCLVYLRSCDAPYLDNGETVGHGSSGSGSGSSLVPDAHYSALPDVEEEGGLNSGGMTMLELDTVHYHCLPSGYRKYGKPVAWGIVIFTTLVNIVALMFTIFPPNGAQE